MKSGIKDLQELAEDIRSELKMKQDSLIDDSNRINRKREQIQTIVDSTKHDIE